MAGRRLPPWSWHGLVAVVLAFAVGGGYAAVLIITALQDGPITEGGAALLNNLGGMLAGALAGWLGGSAVTAANTNLSSEDADTGPYVEPNDPRYTGEAEPAAQQQTTGEGES